MSITLKGGIFIGVLCALWSMVMMITGWYKDPVLMNVFFVVILIQMGVLVWGLKRTAEYQSYMGQVKIGSLMSLYGGIFLFLFSMFQTGVMYPHYFEDMRVMYSNLMLSQGLSGTELSTKVDEFMASQTSLMQAVSGFIGTVATGVVVSLIIGIFYKKK